jgi:hypothetical protein
MIKSSTSAAQNPFVKTNILASNTGQISPFVGGPKISSSVAPVAQPFNPFVSGDQT